MMILYIATEEHEDLLDRLDIPFVKKMIGNYDIEKFFREELLRLDQINTLVLDIHCVQNGETDFLKAIRAFLEVYPNKKIIFYAEQIDIELIKKFIEVGIYNIITTNLFGTFKEKMEKALVKGFSREEALKEHLKVVEKTKENFHEKKYSFIGKGIMISVYGLKESAGCTSTVFNLGYFLANQGAKVMIAGIDSEELLDLSIYYRFSVTNQQAEISSNLTIYEKDCSFSKSQINSCNFLVVDMGILPEEDFLEANITIISSFAKEKDLKKIEKIQEKTKTCFYFLRSAEESKKEEIRKRCKSKNIFYADDMPSFFGEENHVLYEAICSEYMFEVQ